jgi:ABC-type polysaccharide transport system permease subunit
MVQILDIFTETVTVHMFTFWQNDVWVGLDFGQFFFLLPIVIFEVVHTGAYQEVTTLSFFNGPVTLFLIINHTSNEYQVNIHNSTAYFPKIPYTLAGLEIPTFGSSGRCDDHCASPPSQKNWSFF